MAFYKKNQNTTRQGKKMEKKHTEKQMFETLEGRVLLSATGLDEQLLGAPTGSFGDSVVEQSPAPATQSAEIQALAAVTALEITTPAILPQAVVGEYYSTTLQATGGVVPYVWSFPGAVPGDQYPENTQAVAAPAIGQAKGWQGDDVSYVLNLPWAFNFYGVDYTSVRVCTNGFLDFASSSTAYSNSTAQLISNKRIAPLWDDLLTDQGGDIYVNTSDPNAVNIRWKGRTFSGNNSVDFSVTLHRNGDIRFFYHQLHSGITPTIGISSGDGTHYTLSQRDSSTQILNNQTSKFSRPTGNPLPAGLAFNPATGEISGTPIEQGVTVFSAMVTDSDNPASQVSKNFTLDVALLIPSISLQGNGQTITNGDITPSPDDHTDFGPVDINGGVLARTFTVTNGGTGTLALNSVTVSGSTDFVVTQQPAATVAPGASTTFTVTFNPSSAGLQTATVTLGNNTANQNPFTFRIQGQHMPLAITTPATLPQAAIGQNYSVLLEAVGGVGPYTWSFPGAGGDNYVEANPGDTLPGSGVAKGWKGDDASYVLNLPWAFNYYGVDYNSVNVCTNGFLDFVSATTDYSNTEAELISNVRIAPLWDDLKTTDGDIYVDTSNPEAVRIRWQGVTYSGNVNVDFSVTLYRNGNIRMDYHINHSSLTPTIGISAGDGQHYVLSQHNGSNVIAPNTASTYKLPVVNPLPTGLVLNGTTGEISGIPTEQGVTVFDVVVADASNPASQVTRQFTLDVTAVLPEINLIGNGQPIANGDTTPSAGDHTDFGSLHVNAGFITRTYTIQNIGTADLLLGQISLTGSTDFQWVTSPSGALAPGASANLVIAYDPSSGGLHSATVSIANNDSDENPYTFRIQGTGIVDASPEINIKGNGQTIVDGDTSPSVSDSTDFGGLDINSSSASYLYTIENLGTAILSLGTVSLSGSADFMVTQQPAATVAPGASTTFMIRFDPSSVGLKTATVTIANNDSNENPYDFRIQGTGLTTPVPEINIKGNGLNIVDGDTTPATGDHTDFGSVDISGGQIQRTFTIENLGTATLNLSSGVVVSGSTDFVVVAQPPATLAPGSSTVFTVRFDPSSVGLKVATISIANNDANENPYDFVIQGTGFSSAVPEINIKGNGQTIVTGDTTPSTGDATDFGQADINGGIVTHIFTIENQGSGPLTLGTVTVSGSSDFTVTQQPQGTVAAGGSTTFMVTFNPSSAGLKTATISVPNNDSNENPYTFRVQGSELPLSITTAATLPGATVGQNYSVFLQAQGGMTPYTWSFPGATGSGYTETLPGNSLPGSGTAKGWQADDAMYTLNLPWAFNFYGTNYSSVNVCTNGFLDFASSATDYNNSNSGLINNARIAPLWDDLRTDLGGDIYVDTSNPNAVRIRWVGRTYSGGANVDFSVTLYQTGNVRFDYHINHSSLTPTIGVSAGDGQNYELSQRNDSGQISANSASLFERPAANPLPAGLQLNSSTGEIYGIPTQEGVTVFTAQVTDSAGLPSQVSRQFTLAVTTVVPNLPEINIRGNGQTIADGDTTPSTGDSTDFGSVDVAGNFVTRTFTIENTGTANLNLGAVSLSGSSDFQVVQSPSATVTPGGSTTFSVAFDPSSVGLKVATISIANNDANENPYDFVIQGTGFSSAVPEINIKGNGQTIVTGDTTPSTGDATDFGTADITFGYVTKVYTVENTGTGVLTLGSVTVTGNSDFRVTQQPASTVTPGGSTSFAVTFDPSSAGLKTATISVPNNDSNENPYTFRVQGRDLPLAITTPATLPSAAQGNAYSVVLGVEGGQGPYTWSFQGAGSGNYLESTPAAGSSSFGTAKGWRNDDASYQLNLPWAFNFYGTNYSSVNVCTNGFLDFASSATDYNNSNSGLINNVRIAPLWDDLKTNQPGGDIYVDTSDPNAVKIRWQGVTYAGNQNVDFSVTLYRSGDIRFDYYTAHSGLTPTIGISRGNGTDYVLSQRNSSTTISNGAASLFQRPAANPLPAGLQLNTTTGEIFGTPTVQETAIFTVVATDATSNQVTRQFTLEVTPPRPEMGVLGNGLAIVDGDTSASVADATHFGSVNVSGAFEIRQFTITNTGSAPLNLGAVGLTGSTDFSIVTSPNAIVTPGGSTNLVIAFDPSTAGIKTATVSIANNDSDENPYNFVLEGIGITAAAPEIAVVGNNQLITSGDTTPSLLDGTEFGSTINLPLTRTYTIENQGSTPLNLGSVVLAGDSAFVVTQQPATTVAPGASTTFTIRLNPLSIGFKSARVTIANNDGNENPFVFDIHGYISPA